MEGAKVYIQDAGNTWMRANVIAALGNSRYKVQKEPWEDEVGSAPAGGAEIVEVDASKMEGGMLPFQNANMPENGFANMTTLDHLHEAALLHNLRRRMFAGGCPYTYTADIVIALNPYRWYPELYTDDVRKEYLVFDKKKLPPHAYATSSAAYSGLQETHVDQAILVSGESGAGKTETVKILMGHLAMIASSDNSTHITRIVESNPLLESFGNAQTIRNDNSSRFGKFIELELSGACRLVGSKCRTYLLEKSRVVTQDAGERNYHILYQMLAAPPEIRASFGLQSATHTREEMRYTRLGNSPIDTIEGKTDGERYHLTVKALELVDVTGDVLTTLMRALASVLLLGQLTFEKTSDEASKFEEGAAEDAKNAAAGLEVDLSLLEKALTRRSIRTRNESFSKSLSSEAAEASRDAISKELYSRIFDWLVTKICKATGATDQTEVKHFIGLLDIFGFECFDVNRFPQMCINYANEKLQQKFTMDVFKTVQQEYSEEGIPWDRIEFKDNSSILALIEAKVGIIAMLNEECVRPKGAEDIFVSKLVSVHKADPAFSVPRLGKDKEFQFSIKHYAGSVTYTTHKWLDRNRDSVSDDLTELMQSSSNTLISSVFTPEKVEEVETQGKAKSVETVATKFKSSLAELMATISKTNSQYVRCIKPNKNKSPVQVENTMVVEQLRCAGVIEAIRISRAGFPARMPLKEFADRFTVLVRAAAGHLGARLKKSCEAVSEAQMNAVLSALSRKAEAQEICRLLMATFVGTDDPKYEIGRTRVYFKSGVLEFLEEKRAMLMQAAATYLVVSVRGWQCRRRFQRVRRAALKLQANLRRNRARKTYLHTRSMAVRCQAFWRAILARRRVAQLQRVRAATRIQTWSRKLVALNEFKRARRAAVRIQSVVRKNNAQRQYVVFLQEHKEQSKLENQVKALQARLAAAESGSGVEGAGGTAPSAEPSSDILEALQALATENQKLRVDLDKVRTDNLALRQENKELRAGQSKRDDWFSFSMLGGKKKGHGNNSSGSFLVPDTPRSQGTEDASFYQPPVGLVPDVDTFVVSTPGAAVEVAARRSSLTAAARPTKTLRHYMPLCEFWEDVPCAGFQVLKKGSEVHIKFGCNILFVDEAKKHLVHRPWMHAQNGYMRSMGFLLERVKERRSVISRGSLTLGLLGTSKDVDNPSLPGPEDDVCIGATFCLRSATTRKYVSCGGLFDRCLQVTAEKAQDAAVFTITAMPSAAAANTGEMSDAAYGFALRLQGENKYVSLRKDGYLQTSAVADDAMANIENETMAASMEYLVPSNTYELTVDEVQIGLTVGKDLPLRVVGFSAVNKDGHPQPGPAERTGRVRLHDIITHVNGQDIAGFPRKDVLGMIACKRPIVLGFSTGTATFSG